ncbi:MULTISPECIES: hypothetical protein [unclassified Lentimonas]|uniref:hypothetical protein n=1 Tax=unclassified Lentimonas TaxID=2630993 RepID=UPI0013250772|nr:MULTISPECIES: hypothetical protein [unclassified Lentimonas]CAA6679640.1 Unannotated [Lentimonas sp. CC4]CAA6683593.1 Unannotated [Lentimonas sp. CC6]CAA7077355.1 Unannotated [Lentimonas sp. CC4]CAA7170126.1 Unannotated [Lentimonas sp. CC21]CAA7182483.1 Unannotated [Lentimonas sp. CC8]
MNNTSNQSALLRRMITTSVFAFAASTFLLPKESSAQSNKDWPMDSLSGGWYYDTTSRNKQSNHLFNIGFKANKVSFSDGKLICKSDNLPSDDTIAYGGGVRHNTAFNGNRITARCRMVANGSTSGSSAGGSNSLKDQVKRSQASFWLEPSGTSSNRKSHEIDFFELKPNQVIVANFIKWDSLSRTNIGIKDFGELSAATDWANYTCLSNSARTFFKVKRDSDYVRWTRLSDHNVGSVINIHNKPWRFDNVDIPGKVATLECAWVDR